MEATQVSLTVVFSKAMKTAMACGTTGLATPPSPTGVIDADFAARYAVEDPALQESIASTTQVRITSDCATITLVYGLAASAGRHTLTVRSVVDRGGAGLDPARASVSLTITDEGRPQVVNAGSSGNVITVTYTEPMMEVGEGGGAAMLTNYRLDGNTPSATSLSCVDAGCRGIRMTLPSGSLVPGRAYELRIANVVDRSGKNIAPDPTTITFVAG